MIGLILAAGQGSRLRPLTNSKPKCLVDVAGKPILIRQTDNLRAAGIQDIRVVTGYRGEMIRDLGYETIENKKFATTNMLESLMCARHLFDGTNDILVSYGDIVTSTDVILALKKSSCRFSVSIDLEWERLWRIRFNDPLTDAESLRVSDGLIREIGKRPRSIEDIQGQYMGLFMIKAGCCPEVLEFYDKLPRESLYDGRTFENMFMTTFLQLLVDASWPIGATPVRGGWFEIDSTDDLMAVEAAIAGGMFPWIHR